MHFSGTTESILLVFKVHFLQDWAFVRSLLDTCRRESVNIIFRGDCIDQVYLYAITNYCIRVGVEFTVIQSCGEGIAFIDRIGSNSLSKKVFLTATEGSISAKHSANSVLVHHARSIGFITVCFQHGMNFRRDIFFASQLCCVWSVALETHLNEGLLRSSATTAVATGSPKFYDVSFPSGRSALEFRLGINTDNFKSLCLVATNCHWNIHDKSPEEIYHWLDRLSGVNPNVLFIIKPHPDDTALYQSKANHVGENLKVIDELTLLALDWPASRLFASVDCVITTYSTVIFDAWCAGKPLAVLPFNRQCTPYSPESIYCPADASLPPCLQDIDRLLITQEEWLTGRMPSALGFNHSQAADRSAIWYDVATSFFSRFWGCIDSHPIVTPASSRSPVWPILAGEE